MGEIYSFSNENVTSFKKLYNFDNASILSVLGSGDHYFSSLLYGAKNIELFDKNELAWDFFLLKYYAILTMDYDSFFDLFVNRKFSTYDDLANFLSYLPSDTSNRLVYLFNRFNSLSVQYSNMTEGLLYNDGDFIPYLNKDNYYKLQSILKNSSLPIFYANRFSDLPTILDNKKFDIILTSNIFDWMYVYRDDEDIKLYKQLLNKFYYSEIQASYAWNLSDKEKSLFLKNGFEVDNVSCAKTCRLIRPNYVVSLRK